jgi:hypothetical protein
MGFTTIQIIIIITTTTTGTATLVTGRGDLTRRPAALYPQEESRY